MHFMKVKYTEKDIKLICGCTEMSEHVGVFMANFCNICGRKMANKSNDLIGICAVCERKGSQR